MFIKMLCIVALSATLLLPACGGGGARSTQSIQSTTKGQELLDIKNAYDQGIISEREYNNQKSTILNRK